MRYRETGEVHKDFHLGTSTTIAYVLDKYGEEFLAELFRRTAQRVYRDIHVRLKDGDAEALIEHWAYYYQREGGRYEVLRSRETIVFRVLECPAAAHVQARTGTVPDHFLLATILLNRAWSEDTPFTIDTERIGPGEYTMTIRGGHHASQ
jgi:hypothetical protein